MTQNQTILELPPYTIRRSKRARNISMNITEWKGLELVLPIHASEKLAEKFILQHQDWIKTNLANLPDKRFCEDPKTLPSSVHLRAIQESWQVSYHACNKTPKVIPSNHFHLSVEGNIHHRRICREKLARWVRSKAKAYLTEKIHDLSKESGLSFRKVTIRGQKTRWGSCSEHKDISLNYKLIFLPEKLVNYVIIHELCHTVHLHHGRAFWVLLGQFVPDYKALIKVLKKEQSYLPGWISYQERKY